MAINKLIKGLAEEILNLKPTDRIDFLLEVIAFASAGLYHLLGAEKTQTLLNELIQDVKKVEEDNNE